MDSTRQGVNRVDPASVRPLTGDACRSPGLPTHRRADLTTWQRELVALRVAHLLEVETGFRGGDPLRPGLDESKACCGRSEPGAGCSSGIAATGATSHDPAAGAAQASLDLIACALDCDHDDFTRCPYFQALVAEWIGIDVAVHVSA